MNDRSRTGFEDRLRAALSDRAASVSAPAEVSGMASVAAGARRRHTRRRWEAAALALVVVMAAGLGAVVSSGGGSPRQTAGRAGAGAGAAGGHRLDRRDGVLVLPLSGTVTDSASGDAASRGGGNLGAVPTPQFNGAAPGVTGTPNASSPPTTAPGPIDVSPSASPSLRHLFAHTSPDGVQVTVFDQPAPVPASSPPSTVVGPAASGAVVSPPAGTGTAVGSGAAVSPPAGTGTVVSPPAGSGTAVGTGTSVGPDEPVEPPQPGCLTTTQLTVEVSDTAAVGTASEPLFSGASGALVDVQIGEIGSAEGAPATWVMAQVGTGATTVEVQFADGTVDQVAVPSSGVVVLSHKGAPGAALGNGSTGAIDVLGSTGQVLAGYGLGTTTSVPSGGQAPMALPAPGPVQPADPGAATAAVTHSVESALGCSASPLQRLHDVAGGGALETLPAFGNAAVNVDKVVFTSATAAVVEYHLSSGQGGLGTAPLYADATDNGSTWQLSLASVAPGIQVTPANQVGNVTVAPGGPLFVESRPGGTAVAVYKALPGSQSSSGYGTGDAACTPAGGVVEEVTTPGAVGVLTAALFPNYTTPLISAAVSTVGSAEGSPATVVAVEVGPQVTSVSVTGSAGTVQESPVGGYAAVVLAGDPSTALGAAGSQLQVSDSNATALATVSLQVDATAPSGPASLPSTLPAPAVAGQQPADPRAATQAIDQVFSAVFDCATPPIQRVQQIQDGSLVAGALEQLDTGPFAALASSSYVDVSQVVFESPTLADVAYTILFHSDPGMTLPMIGQAVVVAGSWRVSYATVCAAVQLGLGNCQT